MSQEMRMIVNRIFDLWNTGDLTIADEIFAPNYVNHDMHSPDVRTLADYKEYVVRVRRAMPDFQVRELDMIFGPDRGAGRWVASGTHAGELMGVPPTGKQAEWEGVTIYRFSDGKIVEGWWYRDTLTMLQQLGVIPAMRQPA